MTEFLGIETTFRSSEDNDFIISMNGIKSIRIKNHFFSKYKEAQGYITTQALPNGIQYWSDSTLSINNLPILYGTPQLEENQIEFVLQADIISSAFFMLSRWEEIVDEKKDGHLRSEGIHSIAYKFNFLHKPIINEYADLMWQVILKAGYKHERKKHHFKNIVTHDVDQQFKWPDWFTGLKRIGGDLLKRNDIKLTLANTKSLINTKILGAQDPFDQYDYLIQCAKKYNTQSFFNFIISRESKEDAALPIEDPRLKKLINRIEAEGHTIGFHPGYNTYLDQCTFNNELKLLQSLSHQKISSGRQHFLRFKVPYTWRLWDKAGMEWESTMSYSDVPGFRCGTCFTYTVFDCIERKKLTIKEKPLILMDATLVYYMSAIDYTKLYELKNECKKHGGEFVTIWHNDLVDHPSLMDFEKLIYD